MRHFGHGVGHLKYERQHEIETNHGTNMALDDSESSDDLDAEDSDPGEPDIGRNCDDEVAVDSDEEEEEYDGEIVDDEEGDWPDSIISELDGSDGSDSDGYASY